MTPIVRVTKRLIDIVGASIGLAATLPLLPVAAAAIGVESMGWKVVLRRRRAGRLVVRDGGPKVSEFSMLRLNTGESEPEVVHPAADVSRPIPGAGPIARVVRRFRLDELAQLVNVLLGDMSLVGPRPERPELINVLIRRFPFYDQILSDLKPGLTGLDRVSFEYSDRIPTDAALEPYQDVMAGQFALAEDLRFKFALDMTYSTACDDLKQYLRLELGILLDTPFALWKKALS